MIEINLLPWRDTLKHKKRRDFSVLLFVLLIIVVISRYWFYKNVHPATVITPINNHNPNGVTTLLHELHYVGFIHQNQSMLGLVSFRNELLSVREGIVIVPGIRVVKMTEEKLILSFLSHQSYSLYLSA